MIDPPPTREPTSRRASPVPDRADSGAARDRALVILRSHGRASTSFQTLERDFAYFFDGEDAFVAYRDTGRAWVAAGEPVAPPDRVPAVAERFASAARRAGRRVCFFGIEAETVRRCGLRGTAIGEEPVWDPTRWPDTLRSARRLREQLRRAQAKGVVVRPLTAAEVRAGGPLRDELEALAARWLEGRRMAAMAFLVQVDPFARPEERTYLLAERDGRAVELLVAVPIYARRGWLVEHVFRDPSAPNGTTERLIDALMRQAAEEGAELVSLGLAPLAGEVARPLRLARRLGRRFYNFEGLRAFKARLRPDRWERRFLGWPHRSGPLRATLDVLTAFTPRGLLAFAADTARHLRLPLVRLLWLLLIPWTVLVALGSPRWFPSPAVKWAWVAFDVVLVLLVGSLLLRWRRPLLRVLVGLVGLDTALTYLQAVAYNLPRLDGPLDAVVVGLACLAPTLALGALATLLRDEHC